MKRLMLLSVAFSAVLTSQVLAGNFAAFTIKALQASISHQQQEITQQRAILAGNPSPAEASLANTLITHDTAAVPREQEEIQTLAHM